MTKVRIFFNPVNIQMCDCGSPLDHYKKNGGIPNQIFCSIRGCLGTDIAGAYVNKNDDTSLYIVPLCRKHFFSEEELDLSELTTLVPAEPELTCKKGKDV